MNFMGMGVMELGVVLVIAFLVLGPSRSIDMARSAGKLIGDLRRSFNDVMEAVNLEQEQEKGPSGRVPVDYSEGPDSPEDNKPPDKQTPDNKTPSQEE